MGGAYVKEGPGSCGRKHAETAEARVFPDAGDPCPFRGNGGGRCGLREWADTRAAGGQDYRGVWTGNSLLGCRLRTGGGAGARVGKPQRRLAAGAGTAGAEVPAAGAGPDWIRKIGEAAARLQRSDLCGFSERVLAATESGEDEPGGGITGRMDFRAVCDGIGRRRTSDPHRQTGAGGCCRTQTRRADS